MSATSRRRRAGVVWAIVAALAVTAAGLAVPVSRLTPLDHAGGWPWLLLFAAAFWITEDLAVHVEFRGQALTFSLSEAPIVAGLFFALPIGLVGAQIVGVALALALRRRQPLQKLLFNVMSFSVELQVALLTFHALLGPHGSVGQRAWGAALVAAVVQNLLGAMLVSAVILVMDGHARVRDMVLPSAFDLGGAIAVTTMALSGVLILATQPASIWLLVCTWAMLAAAYREIVSSRERQQSLAFLYQASQKLGAGAGFDTVVASLLDEVRSRFRSERAELVLVASPSAPVGVRTTVGPDDHVETMRSVRLDDVELAFLAADDQGECTVVTAADRGPMAELLRRRGIREAMLVRLTAEDEVLGALLVANRLGDVANGFGPGDRTLFVTVANQIRTALDNGRLERNVTHLTELKDELRHQAFHDPLTGLSNRVLFTTRVEEALAGRAGTDDTVAVLFVDLDDFKTVNDTMGHAAGDELLRQVANLIRECLRPSDTAARLGGDEFAVCLPFVHDVHDAQQVAARLLQALGAPFRIEGRQVWVRASIGIARNQGDGWEAAELLRCADVAMYMAKVQGKSRFEVFDAGMHEQVGARHALKVDLQRAVERDEFVVHYQPIVDVESGDVTGAEALVRWRHPSRGIVMPDEFVAVAEELGLIGVIGGRVLRTACEQLRAWRAEFPDRPHLSMNVNVSARQLRQPNFADEVAAVLADTGVDAGSLVLEITESAMVGDAHGWRETLHALKRVGVLLAVDDFGTGYSALSYLHDLPIDVLKIAKPFVDGLDRGPKDAALGQAIVGMGRSLQLAIVAEGVERPQQRHELSRLGCPSAQGYLFGRPVAAAEFAAHLAGPDATVIPLARRAAAGSPSRSEPQPR